MKTNKLLFLGVLGLMSLIGNAQVVNQSNPSGTSVGSGAGTSTVASGSTYYGYQAGNASSTTTANLRNSFFGDQAGKTNSTGSNNTYVGYSSGLGIATATGNSYFGSYSGNNNQGGSNTGVGYNSLSTYTAVSAFGNTALGTGAGTSMASGNYNVFVGQSAGAYANGSNNVLIGNLAGFSPYPGHAMAVGSGNVLIGNSVGNTMGLNNKLFIDNTNTATPLIWGDFTSTSRQVKLNGKTGIGFGTLTTFPTMAGSVNVSGYNLFVTGGILTEEIRVNLKNTTTGLWADYVFNKDYDLKPLAQVEEYIAANGHLQNVPSAQQVKEDGIELGEMAKIQQEKIEELTLYLIQQNKAIEELKAQVKVLSERK